MAGIKEALIRVSEHRNIGRVLAMGKFQNSAQAFSNSKHRSSFENKGRTKLYAEAPPTKYLIIQLKKDNGYITVYDYGSDIHIAENVKIFVRPVREHRFIAVFR